MTDIKTIAGETDITPLNGNVRIQGIVNDGDGHTMHGTVTDAGKSTKVKYGDVVYFLKESSVIMRVNGQEIVFVNESNLVFKVG